MKFRFCFLFCFVFRMRPHWIRLYTLQGFGCFPSEVNHAFQPWRLSRCFSFLYIIWFGNIFGPEELFRSSFWSLPWYHGQKNWTWVKCENNRCFKRGIRTKRTLRSDIHKTSFLPISSYFPHIGTSELSLGANVMSPGRLSLIVTARPKPTPRRFLKNRESCLFWKNQNVCFQRRRIENVSGGLKKLGSSFKTKMVACFEIS